MAEYTGEAEDLAKFIDGLRQAEDSARKLAFKREDTRWIMVESVVRTAREKAALLAGASMLRS